MSQWTQIIQNQEESWMWHRGCAGTLVTVTSAGGEKKCTKFRLHPGLICSPIFWHKLDFFFPTYLQIQVLWRIRFPCLHHSHAKMCSAENTKYFSSSVTMAEHNLHKRKEYFHKVSSQYVKRSSQHQLYLWNKGRGRNSLMLPQVLCLKWRSQKWWNGVDTFDSEKFSHTHFIMLILFVNMLLWDCDSMQQELSHSSTFILSQPVVGCEWDCVRLDVSQRLDIRCCIFWI